MADLVRLPIRRAEESVCLPKEMEVGKDAGEKVPIALPIVMPNHQIVYGDLSVRLWIKPRKYFEEGRFSASVTARDKNQFASGKLKIERLQGERRQAAL